MNTPGDGPLGGTEGYEEKWLTTPAMVCLWQIVEVVDKNQRRAAVMDVVIPADYNINK